MTQTTTTDVLIVGLGPVGAALALLLGNHGIKVIAIDQAQEIYALPRAISLDHEALRILQMAGVQEGEFETVVIPQVQYHSPIWGRFARINSARQIDALPALVTFFQPELEAVLRRKISQLGNVQVHLSTKLESFHDQGSHVQAELLMEDGVKKNITAKYLIGADGSNSLVRRTLGFEFAGKSYDRDWLIVDAKQVKDPIDHVEFICDPKRPAPHMIAPGGRQRWEFMLHPGEKPELMNTPETIRKLLKPSANLDEMQIERTAVYRFHARLSSAFSKGRCFLMGDAAHISPPFAGQGLVSGLRDAANLTWKLKWVMQGKAHEGLLKSYDTERRPHAEEIIAMARFLGNLSSSNPVVAFLLHGFVRIARFFPPGKAAFDEMKIKPPNTFKQGFFRKNKAHKKLVAGSSFPQSWIRRPDGQITRSDDVMGQNFALVGFGVDPFKHLDPQTLSQWRATGGTIWQCCYRGQNQHLSPAEHRFEVLDSLLMPDIAPVGWAAVVRPDQCVFSEAPVEQANRLLQDAMNNLQQA